MTPVNPKVLESLNYGITSEIKSYVFYTEAARAMDNEEFKATLMKLAAEEKQHFQVLERQHHSLIKSEQWVSYNDILKEKGLPDINEEMARTHKDLIDAVKNAKGKREILDIALGLEHDANRIFSRAAKDAVDPEERKTFEFLAKFELGHVRIIEDMIASL